MIDKNVKEYIKKCYYVLAENNPDILTINPDEIYDEQFVLPKEMQIDETNEQWKYCKSSISEKDITDTLHC